MRSACKQTSWNPFISRFSDIDFCKKAKSTAILRIINTRNFQKIPLAVLGCQNIFICLYARIDNSGLKEVDMFNFWYCFEIALKLKKYENNQEMAGMDIWHLIGK